MTLSQLKTAELDLSPSELTPARIIYPSIVNLHDYHLPPYEQQEMLIVPPELTKRELKQRTTQASSLRREGQRGKPRIQGMQSLDLNRKQRINSVK